MSDPRQQRKLWYAVGAVAILAFVAFGANSFKSNLTPYVSFEEAMRHAGKVQIAGALVDRSSRYMEASQELSFGLVDEHGSTIEVRYMGIKPGNFEEATQVVAVGTYHDDAFHADQLLVKCPSKYQGVDSDVTTHGSEV